MQRNSMNTNLRRLEETLQILQSKTNSVQSHRKHSPHKESQNSQSYNRFVPLDSTGDSDGNAMEAEDTAWMTNTNKDRPTKTETEILDRHCVLQDDDLGGWIEFHYLICVGFFFLGRIMSLILIEPQSHSMQYSTNPIKTGRKRRTGLYLFAWLRGYHLPHFMRWAEGTKSLTMMHCF